MVELDRSREADAEWIRPLLTAAADGIVVGPVSHDELIATGRARLVRRRVLAGTALGAVLACVLGGYAIAERAGAGGAGHVAVTVSATADSDQAGRAKPADTAPTPAVS